MVRVKGGPCGSSEGGNTVTSNGMEQGIELQTKRKVEMKGGRRSKIATPKGDNDDLWRLVLSHLEVMAEMEQMSAAGSFSDIDDDELDEEFDEEEFMLQQANKTVGLGDRFNEALERYGEANLTELELTTILSRLRERELPDAKVAMTLVDRVRDHLHEKAATCVDIPKPSGKGIVVIVGDLHGHLNDLLKLIDTYGMPSPNMVYLFNGDFVDRGIWGPEVLFFLYCLRLLHPNHVYLNRGNHETKFCTDRYGFNNDLAHAYPSDYEELYARVLGSFDQLPLCHIIGESVFVAHGGLPQHSIFRRDLDKIKRGPFPMHGRSTKIRTFQALLWSDPKDQAGASARGMGFHFNQAMTEEFLANNNVKCIIRSHECVNGGYVEAHNGQCMTVFSASNYDGHNDASVVIVDSSMNVNKGEQWNEPYLQEEWGDVDDPNAARSGWKMAENSDKRAMDALASRVGDDKRWNISPKQRVLENVCSQIFLYRSDLLDKFQSQDDKKKDTIGKVSQQNWREIMGLTLKTPADFPWEALGPYLYKAEEDGSITYVDFLLRYDSPFAAWLADKWCNTVLSLVANRASGYHSLFGMMDSNNTGVLPYSSMRVLLHKILDMKKAVDSTESMNEAVRNFALFRKLDVDNSGKITKEEFNDALATYKVQSSSRNQCCNGHQLKSTAGLTFFQSVFCCEGRICNRCNQQIAKGEKIWECEKCNYDLCTRCYKDLGSMIFNTYIHLKGEEEQLQETQLQWECVEQGLRAAFKSGNDIVAMFSLVDKGDGQANHKNFVKHMGRALRREAAFMESLYAVLCHFVLERRLESGKTGPLTTKELVDCFAVRDRGEDADDSSRTDTALRKSMKP